MALDPSPLDAGRPPRQVRPGLWLFAPSRDSQGGSSWLLEGEGEQPPLLIDCPGLTEANLQFLERFQAERRGAWVLTSREGHGRCRRLQQRLGWPVWVQEQEAYLLPGVAPLQAWGAEQELAGARLLWTPGPTPGAAVLHVRRHGLDLLFCGRLLLPTAPGRLEPLRSARTFHWPRQLASVERLRAWLPAGSPAWIACGGGLGALRGAVLVPAGAAW